MIGTIFSYRNEYVEVRIDGNNVLFRSSAQQYGFVPFNERTVKLDYDGVVREFPDLAGLDDWKKLAVDRFYNKLSSLLTEDEKMDYIIADLRKHGYLPLRKQKAGYRVEIIKK